MTPFIPNKFKYLSVILIIFVSTFGFAQNKETTSSDSLKVDVPEAIPVVNIIDEIEVAEEKLKDIERKIQPNSFIEKIDSLYPTYKKFITTKRKQAKSFITANPNKQKANNLLSEWRRYHDYLKSWETSINKNFERNSIILEDVIFQEKTWDLTYENSKNENIPSQILETINSIKNKYKDTKNKIIKLNNKELILESKINFQMSVTTDVIESIEQLKTSHIYDILYKRHNTLWNTPFTNATSDSIIVDKEATFNNISLEFLKTFEKTFYLFAFIVILLVALIKYLKKGYDIYPLTNHNQDVNKSESLLYKKPRFVIIFLSLFLAKILFKNVPDLINDIFTLLLLITTIPIVNPYISKKFKNIVYIVIVFFILDSAKTYIWFQSYQYRFYLLFEAALVIFSLYYFTHPFKQIKAQSTTKLAKFLINISPLFYFLAIVSIVSNLLGYTNLTDISLKICTQGIVLSVVFYGILRVLDSISLAILHRHFNSKETYDVTNKLEVENKIIKYTRLTIFIFWLLLFLSVLDFLNPIRNIFDDFLTEPYTIGSISFTLGTIITFLIILFSSFAITKLVSFLLDDSSEALSFLHLPKGIPAAISVVLRYLILGFGVVFAISSLGIDLSEFNLMAGALGLGIGFGLQNIISNFVSGLILIFERPILPGDTVEFNSLMGTVRKIGVRSSKVSTFDGADVVVPNNSLVSNDLINWTLSSNIKRIEILIGTSYDSDPNEVLELLLECANSYPDVIKDPAPAALFSDFGNNSLNFRLRFWVHFSLGLKAKSDVSIAIYNSFKAHNIEIPFPQQDVYIKEFPISKKDED